MEEKIILDMLTPNSVSVKKQNYIKQNGRQYSIGHPWRRAYFNSAQGRQQVQEEVPEPYRSAIFAVWGDTPTVEEDTEQ